MMNKINDTALETVTGGIIWPKQKDTRTLLAAAPEKMRLDATSAPWVHRFTVPYQEKLLY